MVLFNYSTKELTAKVVYYGPGLCGKTTNLHWIHEKVPIKNKGKMLSLATETDRTLFFDFLPIELGLIRGMKTRIQLYTVPGQVFYNATRRMVLKGADAVVFVCDSQEAMFDANVESMDNLRQNLEANEINPDEVPMVLQYNKRDLPNALPIEILNEKLNIRSLPHFEAVATKGLGVEDTLKSVTSLVFRSLAGRYGSADDRSGVSHTTAPGIGGPTPAPPPRPTAPVARAAAAPARPAVPQQVTTLPPAPTPEARPPAPPVSSLPTLNIEAEPPESEDLLDSLELTPTPESEDGFALEELDVEAVALDEVPATPPPRPAPADGRSTIASTPREAEELRRRLRTPAPPVDAELEVGMGSEADTGPVGQSTPASRPAGPPQPTLPPQSPAAGRATATSAPVALRLDQNASSAEVTVPVVVSLDRGTAQVNLNLRLVLQLKFPQ
jgi:signal recognition particle receptor subunit beta